MITILKSHTYVTPRSVDDSLGNNERFPGENVDICGRWDADSECIQQLLSKGPAAIPSSWKHKFCHTSAQAICHGIDVLQDYTRATRDFSIHNVLSGLYTVRCFGPDCGLKMQMTPLHTLVMVAYSLAQFGKRDEDLFGILAVLLSCFTRELGRLRRVDIDVSALFDMELLGREETQLCKHQKLYPSELAQLVPASAVMKWSKKTREGWEIFCLVLERIEKLILTILRERYGPISDDYEHSGNRWLWNSYYTYGNDINIFTEDKCLRLLWTAVQTELLTYRRLNEDDPWVSPNFDMTTLLESLRNGEDDIDIGLVRRGMMRPEGVDHITRYLPLYWVRATDVSMYYFANMDDWSRTTFIELKLNEC